MKRALFVIALLMLPPVLLTSQNQVPSGVAKMEFFLDGQPFGPVVTSPPWESTFQWDSTKVPNGQHTITARATDHAGNVGEKTSTFTVANAAPPPPPPQNPPPVIYFITKDGASFTGNLKVIDLHVADDTGVQRCDLMVNSFVHSSVNAFGGRLSATTKFYLQGLIPRGDYTLGANCYDILGGKGSAPAITATKR